MNAREYLSQAHPVVAFEDKTEDVCYLLQDWMAENHNIELDNGGEMDCDSPEELVYLLFDDNGDEYKIKLDGELKQEQGDYIFYITNLQYLEA